MEKKERKQIEVTLKSILYFIDDEKDRKKVLDILINCEHQMGDSKWKNKIDEKILRFKTNYYDKIDFLIEDILSSKLDETKTKIIYATIEQLKPSYETAQRNFWDKLKDLFTWS